MQVKSRAGFTLLEVLIAVFIFTIVAIILTTALHRTIDVQSRTEQTAGRVAELQHAFLIVERDLEQSIDRPIINAKNISESSFIGSFDEMTFTHGGLANPNGDLTRSSLQRVRYTFNDGTWTKYTWPSLDQTRQSRPKARSLLKQVKEIRLEYLDSQGSFHPNWPVEQLRSEALPRGVRLTFTLSDLGKITLFYLITGQSLATQTTSA
jgi:general secretion pathway protein J